MRLAAWFTMRGDAFAAVDEQLRGWVDSRGYSGSVLVATDGRVEFAGCYGLANRADGVPIHGRTRFGLASLTKMFTAVAVVDLVRAGKLDFDTPVVRVLPPERRPSTLLPEVTVGHLLSHTSGIADYCEEEGDDCLDYGALFRDRPVYRMLRPADFLPMFGDLPPYRPPGGRFQYSNAGYVLLGLVIEDAAGAPYIDVVTERVFGPAGMADSGFFALDEVRPDVAVGYLPPHEPGGLARTNIYSTPAVGGADGGAFSNPPDLDRFLTAYDDGVLVGEQLRDAMLTPRATNADGVEMGYGVFLAGTGRFRRFGHGGGDPGFEVLVHRYPRLRTSVIAQCNLEGLVSEVRALLITAFEAAS